MKNARNWSMIVIALAVSALALSTGRAEQAAKGPGPAVKQAIERLLPGGRVLDTEMESRAIRVYELEVRVDGKVVDVTVLENGAVLNVEEEVEASDLPDAVAKKVAELTGGGKAAEIERVEHHGELKVVEIDPARVEYEIEFRTNGKWQQARLAEDGSVVRDDQGFSDDDQEGDDDDDDDDESN